MMKRQERVRRGSHDDRSAQQSAALQDAGAVGEEDREIVVRAGADEFLGRAVAVVVEEEEAEFVVEGQIAWILRDRPLVLRGGVLRVFRSCASAEHETLQLLEVIQLLREGWALQAVRHFRGYAGAIVAGECQ
jgi:hypothetical protein